MTREARRIEESVTVEVHELKEDGEMGRGKLSFGFGYEVYMIYQKLNGALRFNPIYLEYAMPWHDVFQTWSLRVPRKPYL